MKASEPAVQGAMTVVLSWLAARLGVLFAPVILLMIMMAVDYVTGMLASKAEAIAHPENPEYGWASRKGILGIIKKIAWDRWMYRSSIVKVGNKYRIYYSAGTGGSPRVYNNSVWGLGITESNSLADFIGLYA